VDAVTILRRLWRFRLLLLVVAPIALMTGLFVSFKLPSFQSRQYEVGQATARILVDTPASQVIDVAPAGSDTLGVRATLLSSLMVDGVVKEAIARRAGIPADDLHGTSEAGVAGATPAKNPNPRGYSLDTKVLITSKGDPLPVIELTTTGPDAESANRLATASIDGLVDYLKSKAAADAIPDHERLVVSGLGVPAAALVKRGPAPVMAAFAMLFVFGFGCAAILIVDGLVRELKAPPKPPRANDTPREPEYHDDVFWFQPEPENGNGNGDTGKPRTPPAPTSSTGSPWFGGPSGS
jgi:hypothetical protein